MADEAHLAVLKQGADAWNAWRAAHAGTPADLASASLRGLDLAGANLAGADCREADLRGTILSGATLTDANLAGANFFKSVLDAADFAGANLVGARFLNCPQLKTTRNWQSAFRDPDLACGAPVPRIADPP
jgi:uncharacterized protein YjbI with pentapeptide repeats